MRGVDLTLTPFDFDLTFAAVLMSANGHVYHRYGGRDDRGPGVWLGRDPFARALRATLDEHGAGSSEPDPAVSADAQPLFIERIPAFAKRDRGECVHCHSVFPALYEEGRAAGTWRPDDRWVYPPPGRIGLDLDARDQALVRVVHPDSVAERAGLRPGDRLLQHGTQVLVTASDLMQVLHDFPNEGGTFELAFERPGGEAPSRDVARLELGAGWKRGTPREFAWRPFKWGFTPAPGFGGNELTPAESKRLGLAEDTFAFRVTYLVTWGGNQRFGRAAARAGLREGDVFLAAAGKRDFESEDHVHAWWRLTRTPGEVVELEVLRDGERRTISLPVPE